MEETVLQSATQWIDGDTSLSDVISQIGVSITTVSDCYDTGQDPIPICTCNDLQRVRDGANSRYLLKNDVNCSDTINWNSGKGFKPISSGPTLILDGAGHKISSIYVYFPQEVQVGLFSELLGEVKNLTLENAEITGYSHIGCITGGNRGIIINSRCQGQIKGMMGYVGGLVGFNYDKSKIISSSSEGNANGKYDVGGLAGLNRGYINDSFSNSSVDGVRSIGGLAGENEKYKSFDAIIENSHSTGNVNGTEWVIGGFAGVNYGIIRNSYSQGEVSGAQSEAGGFVGQNIGSIENSYSTGNFKRTSPSISTYVYGGFAGVNRGSITGSYSTGNANGILEGGNFNFGSSSVGGFAGINSGNIVSSYSTGKADGRDYIGGLVGDNSEEGVIIDSHSSGEITGYSRVGGLVGKNEGLIESSYSNSTLTGYQKLGGLAGENNAVVTNSFAAGEIKGHQAIGSDYKGGIAGQNTGHIQFSYSTAKVNGGATTGGIAAVNDGIVFKSYYGQSASGQSDSGKGEPRTTAEMKSKLTFADWDFEGIWKINEGTSYPAIDLREGAPSAPILITNCQELQKVNLNSDYYLNENIDCSETSSWNNGKGFIPLIRHGGTFDGKGFSISGLRIDRLKKNDPNGMYGLAYAGLFGLIYEGTVKNLRLENFNITGNMHVGALAGKNYLGQVNDSHSSGEVEGWISVGGLIGKNNGAITGSSSSAKVAGHVSVGGLVGWNEFWITRSYSTGDVIGSGSQIGGLVGHNIRGYIARSFSKSKVDGKRSVGGLVGAYNEYNITDSYFSGEVRGEGSVGGLIGLSLGYVSSSYSSGKVFGTANTGGLLGGQPMTTSDLNSWEANGNQYNSYYDSDVASLPRKELGIPKTTSELKTKSTFKDIIYNRQAYHHWDFINVWDIQEGVTYPYLRGIPISAQTSAG